MKSANTQSTRLNQQHMCMIAKLGTRYSDILIFVKELHVKNHRSHEKSTSHFWPSLGRHHTTSSGSGQEAQAGGGSSQLHWVDSKREGDIPSPETGPWVFILTRHHWNRNLWDICEDNFWNSAPRPISMTAWIHFLNFGLVGARTLGSLVQFDAFLVESGSRFERRAFTCFFLQPRIYSVSFLSNPFYLWITLKWLGNFCGLMGIFEAMHIFFQFCGKRKKLEAEPWSRQQSYKV